MTRRIFDYKCSNDHVNEFFIDESITEVPCKTCGNVAFRIISPVKAMLDVASGDFPGATMKWAKNRQRKLNQENKANSD